MIVLPTIPAIDLQWPRPTGGTVAAVTSLSLAPSSGSIAVGATLQLTATPRDASNNVLTGRVVTYTSSAPSTATVNGAGLVTGVAAGSATITATCEGISVTMATTVTAALANPNALLASADLYRYGLRYTPPRTFDANGAVIGTMQVNATTKRVEGPYTYGAHFPIDRPPVTNAITLTNQGSVAANYTALVNAIAARSSTGGWIYLTAGVEWGENIEPINDGTGTLVICDARYAGTAPRAVDVDVTEADAAAMPSMSITSINNSSLLLTSRTKNVRIIGVNFTMAASLQPGLPYAAQGPLSGLVSTRLLSGGTVGDIVESNTASDYPSWITLEQCVIHSNGQSCCRGMWWNGHFMAMLNCCVTNVGGQAGGDSQGVLTTHGSGPYYVRKGFVATSRGESMAVGTGIVGVESEVPADVFIDETTFDQYNGSDTTNYPSKNLFESKCSRRILLQKPRFQNYVTSGYVGQYAAVVFKSAVGNTGQTWNYTTDATVRGARWVNCSSTAIGFGAFDVNNQPPDHATGRIEVSHSVMERSVAGDLAVAKPYVISVADTQPSSAQTDPNLAVHSLSIHHNTLSGPNCTNTGYATAFEDIQTYNQNVPHRGWEIRGNVMALRDDAGYSRVYVQGAGWANSTREYVTTLTNTGLLDASVPFGQASPPIAGNIVSGTLTSAQAAVGDMVVANVAALLLGTTGAPQTGSPVLTSDIDGGRSGADLTLVHA